MFGIGKFSKITGLTVKTQRFYHEEGLLIAARMDPQTGYRYYAEPQIEIARTITFLRHLEFPLSEINSLPSPIAPRTSVCSRRWSGSEQCCGSASHNTGKSFARSTSTFQMKGGLTR